MSLRISPSDFIKAIEVVTLAYRIFSEHGRYKDDYQSLAQATVALEQSNDFARANAQSVSANDTEFDTINDRINVLQDKIQALATRHSKSEKSLNA